MNASPFLIVNADDFGYFPEVSRGIAQSINSGVVTATSVIVNRATRDDVFSDLMTLDVDAGVHLNLSHGQPLTDRMRDVLVDGLLPDKFALLRYLVTGRISAEMIEDEWRAQLTRVRDAGVTIHFVNCHEHLHMFPGLLGRYRKLAKHFQIPFGRYCTPEWSLRGSGGHWLRTGLFALTAAASRRPRSPRSFQLLGLAPSGDLDTTYLRQILPTLKPGTGYELMCHPGHGTPARAGDLAGYHRWDAERALLCDPATRELIVSHGIRLARFSDTDDIEHA